MRVLFEGGAAVAAPGARPAFDRVPYDPAQRLMHDGRTIIHATGLLGRARQGLLRCRSRCSRPAETAGGVASRPGGSSSRGLSCWQQVRSLVAVRRGCMYHCLRLVFAAQ